MKFESIQSKVGVPLHFMASFEKDSIYRKPNTGMWNHFVKDQLHGKSLSLSDSFYCGDAAGRKNKQPEADGNKSKNDFSSDDLLYSINLGIRFCTPEMFFLGHKLNFKSSIMGV